MIKNILCKEKEKTTPHVIILKGFEDVDGALKLLNGNVPVIVNAAKLERRDGYRVIDFLSGYCYAKNGLFRRIDDMIYRFEL